MSIAEAYLKMLEEKAKCGSKKEAVQIDPDDGEVSKKKEKKSDADSTKPNAIAEEKSPSEKLEPKAKGEKEFKDSHKVDVKPHPVHVHGNQDGTEKVKVASGRPGDKIENGERKLKSLKDVRK